MKAARIVVLGVALAAGGVAALLVGRSGETPPPPAPAPVAQMETVEVLVAKSDIGIGHAVAAHDLQWQTWPAASAARNFIRQSDRPDAIEQLTGSIARVPFAIGEPIREARLIKAKGSGYLAAVLPSGKRAIATEINPEIGVAGFIMPNDHVDVILTRRDREAEKLAGIEIHTSETVLSNVRVLAIDQTVEEKSGQKVVIGKTATLELTPQEVETMVLARQQGILSLALRSIVDIETSNKPESDDKTARIRVDVVRFGVTNPVTRRAD
jgi:pilus assembly protein CpaB